MARLNLIWECYVKVCGIEWNWVELLWNWVERLKEHTLIVFVYNVYNLPNKSNKLSKSNTFPMYATKFNSYLLPNDSKKQEILNKKAF